MAFAQDILQAQAPSLSALSSRPKGMAEWGRVPPEEPCGEPVKVVAVIVQVGLRSTRATLAPSAWHLPFAPHAPRLCF